MTDSAKRTRSTRRGFDSLEQEVFLSLWRTYDRLRALEEALFAQFELTPQQYNVLRILARAAPPGLPTLELASRLVSRAPDITRMLDKLAERSLIARQRPNDNRRVVFASIAPDGVRLLEAIGEPLAACHRRQLGHLPRKDLEQLVRLLRAARAPHEVETSSWR
jgi:DNA-binding MarR family transcriptional regulator